MRPEFKSAESAGAVPTLNLPVCRGIPGLDARPTEMTFGVSHSPRPRMVGDSGTRQVKFFSGPGRSGWFVIVTSVVTVTDVTTKSPIGEL
jgi:hypothetical protein